MDFEIEFFPVGDATKAGDAIVVRYGQNGTYEVAIIDGGTAETGEAIVKHVREVYGPNVVVSHVISTHPDSDHASGLRAVLRELPVLNLWVHGLWAHAQDALPFFNDGRWTVDGLQNSIRSEYPIIEELFLAAAKQRTPIYEPFEGAQIGPFRVLSPTPYAYQRLLPQFRKTPDANEELLKQQNMYLGAPKGLGAFVDRLLGEAAAKAASFLDEHLHLELLREGGVTAAENETSVVLWGDFGATKVLLTADAGLNALTWAIDYASRSGIQVQAANLVQIPHHGSRRNVSPSVLDRLLGPRQLVGPTEIRVAVVSAPMDDEKHPRKIVLNAFTRRGAFVRSTQGKRYRYHSGTMPARSDETVAQPLGLFSKVEAYD